MVGKNKMQISKSVKGLNQALAYAWDVISKDMVPFKIAGKPGLSNFRGPHC